jgi:ferritin-like metal-binding protein YciE
LLQEAIEEEKQADEKLTEIAQSQVDGAAQSGGVAETK